MPPDEPRPVNAAPPLSEDAAAGVAAVEWLTSSAAGAAALREARRWHRAERMTELAIRRRVEKEAAAHLPALPARRAAALAAVIAGAAERAAAKLGAADAERWVYDDEALQMASHRDAARYHADILRAAGAERVIDMTAGIGVDSVAFARAGLRVTAYEIDPVRAALCRANALAAGVAERLEVRCDDAATADWPRGGITAVFLDPPRRTADARWGGGELRDLLLARAAGEGGIVPAAAAATVLAKLAPAAERDTGLRWRGELEYVSLEGECREALLRCGRARREPVGERGSGGGGGDVSALLLPARDRLEAPRLSALPAHPLGRDGWREAAWLYEPDPAVIRAGLTDALAASLSCRRVDAGVEYLVTASPLTPAASPFAARYRVLAAMPYHRKPLQAWLDDAGAGALIVKKRGVPDDPEVVRRQFRLTGDRRRVAILALTRAGRQTVAFLLAPPEHGRSGSEPIEEQPAPAW